MKTLSKLALGALLLGSAAAHADIYIGGGVYGTSVSEAGLEDSDVAPAVFLGWRPIELLGVEAGYYDFGSFETAGLTVEGSAMTLAGLLSLELGPVGAYAKAGLAEYSIDVSTGGTANDSADPFGGVGLTVDLADKLYLYGEYLVFTGEDADIDVYGAGLRYSF